MISSGEYAAAGLEALRPPPDPAAFRHYHGAAAQYRGTPQVRHFWPPTPPPDGRYGGGRTGVSMLPPSHEGGGPGSVFTSPNYTDHPTHKEVYFSPSASPHTASALVDPRHYSAFSVFNKAEYHPADKKVVESCQDLRLRPEVTDYPPRASVGPTKLKKEKEPSPAPHHHLLSRANPSPSSKSVPMTPRSTSSQHPSYGPMDFHSSRHHLIPESHHLSYSHLSSVVVKQEIREDSPPPPALQHHHHSLSLPPPPSPSYLLDPRHPTRGVDQQPTNLVISKTDRPSNTDPLRHKPFPANNKFYHSHQNSPFSPPPQIASSQQPSALSSLQSMVSLSGGQPQNYPYDTPPVAHKAKHSPPIGCVLPMPSLQATPSRPSSTDSKKPNYAYNPQEPVNIPVGIAHAHQRAKDLTLSSDPGGKASHVLSVFKAIYYAPVNFSEKDPISTLSLKKSQQMSPSKLVLPPQSIGAIREYKEEFLEKTSFAHFPLTSPLLPHQSGLPPNAANGGGGRWCQPWFPHIWPATGGIPEGCQIVKDPHTGQLLLVDPATGNIATLMGPPSHHWPPYPLESSKLPPHDFALDLENVAGSKIVETKSIKEESPKIEIKKEKEELKKDEEELESNDPTNSSPPPIALPTPIPSAGEEEEVIPKALANNASGLQLLLDVIENEEPIVQPSSTPPSPPPAPPPSQNPTPTTFEMLCSYAHEVFEKEHLEEPSLPLPPKLSSAQKADLSKKVLSLTQAKQDHVVELKTEPSELKLRQQLADLQRKYQENQRGLAELVPKKKSSNAKHKPTRLRSNPSSETPSNKKEHSPTKKKGVDLRKRDIKTPRNVNLRSKTQNLSDHDEKKKFSPKENEIASKASSSKDNVSFTNTRTKKNKVKKPASSSLSSKKVIQNEDSSSQISESDTSPKKEQKTRSSINKAEDGQKETNTSRKRKLVKPKKSASSKSEKTETIVDRVSRNLLFIKAQSIMGENSCDEEDLDLEGDDYEEEEAPLERKRLRAKSRKPEPTKTSCRLSKTQASLSIKKQIGQQQKCSPEKRDKVIKRTRLSLLKRRIRDSRHQQRSPGLEETLSPSKKNRSDLDEESPSSRRGGDKNGKKEDAEECCILKEEHLVENTRVLVVEDGLLYAGILIDIQPPKVYGVVLDGSRGTSPRLFSREELFKSTVREVKPTKVLSEGTRVCAYWSQQYQCLYPGLVAKETSLCDSKSMFVQFDDGDSGKISFNDIRLLSPHLVEVNKDEPSSSCPSPSKSSVEDGRPVRKKKTPSSTKPTTEKKKPSSTQSSGTKSKCSLRLRLSRVIRKRGDLGYHHFFHRRRSLATRPNSLSPSKLRVQASSLSTSSDANNKTEGSSTSPKSIKIEDQKDQLWRWYGKSFRKAGLKGSKSKREYFRAISRKNEKISVGDCVVFLSSSSHQRNGLIVGKVESFWQQAGEANMIVRVKLFIQPQDSPSRSHHKSGLYLSGQEEEKDVQSISHKCQVISSYEEFCQRKGTSDPNTGVFYLAGSYDSSTGQVLPSSQTPC